MSKPTLRWFDNSEVKFDLRCQGVRMTDLSMESALTRRDALRAAFFEPEVRPVVHEVFNEEDKDARLD